MGIALLTGPAAFHLHKGCIKPSDGMALGLRLPDKGIGHSKTVPTAAGAAGKDDDFLTHGTSLPSCFSIRTGSAGPLPLIIEKALSSGKYALLGKSLTLW